MPRRAAVALAAILAIAACKKEAPPPPPAPADVVINAADFSFTAPDTIGAGWTRLRLVNAGPSMHHAQLLKINDGKTFDSLMAAMRNPGPPPSWIKEVGSPNVPNRGDTSDVISHLEAGHYALVCFIPDSLGRPHIALGMSRALEVVDRGNAATEPTADAEIKLSDYTFTESAPLTAGHHTFKIINDGPQTHEIVVISLDSGATAQTLLAWISHGMRGAPPAHPIGGTAGMAAGSSAYMRVNLAAGRYVLICFVPGPDGKDHATHGMVKEFTVS